MTLTITAEMRHHLAHEVEHFSHLLPPQGPISTFIHHNTLHGLQHLPFEQALAEGERVLGGRCYFANDEYRRLYSVGHEWRLSDLSAPQPGSFDPVMVAVSQPRRPRQGTIGGPDLTGIPVGQEPALGRISANPVGVRREQPPVQVRSSQRGGIYVEALEHPEIIPQNTNICSGNLYR